MNTSIFMFASDLHDEGVEPVLDNVQGRGGLGGVTLACTYHHSRDVFPHNPVRKVRFFQGEVFFQPEGSRYEALAIRPLVSPLVAERDLLATLIAAARRRGLRVRAWTNNMHNTSLGSRHPQCVVRNAFGDPYITCLCPANSDARAYARTLTADLARYPVDELLLESVSFMPFDHGYHHERTLIPLSPLAKFLLGLCFCPHCLGRARSAGVDAPRVQRFVRAELEAVLNGEPSGIDELPLTPAAAGALADGELGGYLRSREATVASLVAEIVEAVRQTRDVPVLFMDMSGGLRGVGSGITVAATEAVAPERAWQDGVDLAVVLSACQGLAVLGYAREPNQLRADVAAYRDLVPTEQSLAVVLRPMPPDCTSATDLATRLALLQAFQPYALDFYHYGFMRLTNLDWIGQALGT